MKITIAIGGNQSMKKLLILSLLFVLFGCKTQVPPEPTPEETPEPITYESIYQVRQILPVELFDSIYINDETNVDIYQPKLSIFNQTLASGLPLGSININASELSSTTRFIVENESLLSLYFYQDQRTKTYVQEYLVKDFYVYLSEAFLSHMEQLNSGQITPDVILETYGSHIIVAVVQSILIQIELLIESRDLEESEFLFIKSMLMDSRPLQWPIQDDIFLSYRDQSRITMNVFSTHESSNLPSVLNDFHLGNFTYVNLFTEHDIIPIWRVFGFVSDRYPIACEALENRYQELQPIN
jgi:hypothetical protein